MTATSPSEGLRPIFDVVEAAMRRGPSRLPAVEIFEEAGAIVVSCDVTGARRKDIRVDVAARHVVIAVARPASFPMPRPQNAHCAEFERAVPLPSEVRPEDAQARLNNGVLEIVLPKKTAGGASVRHFPEQ